MKENFGLEKDSVWMEEIKPVDISDKYMDMDYRDFRRFVRGKLQEDPDSSFLLRLDYVNIMQMRKLKALLQEVSKGLDITVRSTREQKSEAANEFTSGINWKEIK